MNIKIFNSKKGFTLVELAIYMGISMVILLILTELLTAIFNTKLLTKSTTGVARDGRYIYTRLTYDVNRAQSVTLPANLGEISTSLVLSIDGAQYIYSVQNGNLVLTAPQGSDSLNGYDTTVSNLTFQRIGNPNGKHTFRINYVITSKVTTNGPPETQSFQTTAGLR